MKHTMLSIVIVNYNVRQFLLQCLESVSQAEVLFKKTFGENQLEIFVVDNHSIDHSIEAVSELFPKVITIALKENLGFAKANNLAIKQSNSKYILLLNPDTYIQEDTLTKIVSFMENNHSTGGLGVKMIDGKGNFLPESKRGLPTPWVAFYKIFGLSSLFPHSKRFGKYHLSYIKDNETAEVDVLSGAFMLLRKETLDLCGLLDETFFMYGEDIDLSYRIKLVNFKNIYFPETQIIHYKGESTKKGSLNYVFVFYKAMAIFARKHFSESYASLFSLFIHFAIFFRAGLAIARRLFSFIRFPLIDFSILLIAIQSVRMYWEQNFIYLDGGGYDSVFTHYILPGYALFITVGLMLSNAYKKPMTPASIWKGMLPTAALLLIVYALMPETYRYSRGVLVVGLLFGGMAMASVRWFASLMGLAAFKPTGFTNRRTIIVGSEEQVLMVKNTLLRNGIKRDCWTIIPSEFSLVNTEEYLTVLLKSFFPQEVIFCQPDVSPSLILNFMSSPILRGLEFKIAGNNAECIIGSDSIQSDKLWFSEAPLQLSKPINLKRKRQQDVFIAIAISPLIPILAFSTPMPAKFFTAWLEVIKGKKHWVSYINPHPSSLPTLKPGILHAGHRAGMHIDTSDQLAETLNFLYARDWSTATDRAIIWSAWKLIGSV